MSNARYRAFIAVAHHGSLSAAARALGVSQPTVIRFCRSLGCEGLSDFKLRLASGLTGTVPITHVQVTDDDSSVDRSSAGAAASSSACSSVTLWRFAAASRSG